MPIHGEASLIPFKAKAWLALTERKASAEAALTAGISAKHKNDILRLSGLLAADFRYTFPVAIENDMPAFMAANFDDESGRMGRVAAMYGLDFEK